MAETLNAALASTLFMPFFQIVLSRVKFSTLFVGGWMIKFSVYRYSSCEI